MTTGEDAAGAPTRVLFAVGTGDYADPAYRESGEPSRQPDSLSQSVPRSLGAVVAAFRRARVRVTPPTGFLLNPSTQQLRTTLREAARVGDLVTIYYTGHGEQFGSDGYYLITTDFDRSSRLETGVVAGDLPKLAVKRGDDGEIDRHQTPILLILDCCFSGGAGLEVLRDAIVAGRNLNLWVWATASKTQYATSGVFAQVLADALGH